jgi:hypothetical protein
MEDEKMKAIQFTQKELWYLRDLVNQDNKTFTWQEELGDKLEDLRWALKPQNLRAKVIIVKAK